MDNTIKKWNQKGELLYTKKFESTIIDLKIDEINNQLIAGSADGQVLIFDVNNDMDM